MAREYSLRPRPQLGQTAGVRTRRWQLGAMALGLGAGLYTGIPLAESQMAGKFMGVDEIKPGMKGYGLTVGLDSQGTKPERFDVEAVAVLKNFRPGHDLFLVKTPHPRLNITKNVKGMSGSPIYFNGKLAGAYAYSLSGFQSDPVPVAGVTAIAPMLAEMKRPIPAGFWPLQAAAMSKADGKAKNVAGITPPAHSPHAFEGKLEEYSFVDHAKQVADRMAAKGGPAGGLSAKATTPVLLAGLSDKAASFVKQHLEPLGLDALQAGSAGTGSTAGAPEHYENGGALGVRFAWGDVSMMGMGTTTYVEGTKVAGFGHPMMDGGNSAFPTCIGRIFMIWASNQHSFKVGECARPLGTLVQDRPSAIILDETVTAPSFPIKFSIAGAAGDPPKKDWNVTVMEHQMFSPMLVGSVLGTAVEHTAAESLRDVSWQMESVVKFHGHDPVTVTDFGAGMGTPSWALYGSMPARVVGALLNNPWERVRVERVESKFKMSYENDIWAVRGHELLDPVVDPGGRVRVKLRLRSRYGQDEFRTLETEIPKEFAGQTVYIQMAPGYAVYHEHPRPENVKGLLSLVQNLTYPPKSMVLSIQLPGVGMTFNGKMAPQLPGFAVDALSNSSNQTYGPTAFTSYKRSVTMMDKYVTYERGYWGGYGLRVQVRPNVR
jgi:hypothetical protein